MSRYELSPRRQLALGLLSVGCMLLFYTYLSHRQHQINPRDQTVPTWRQLAEGVREAVEYNTSYGGRIILLDLAASGTRLFWGLVLGIVGAVAMGLAMGYYPAAESLLTPPLSLLAKIPATGALAVFFAMLGTGRDMFIGMIVFGILPILAQVVFLAVREVPNELLYKAETMGARRFDIIWHVLLRHALPKILDGIRLQIGPAIIYLIAAELWVGDAGLGYRMRLRSRLLDMSLVYPYLVLVAAFGFAADYGMRRLRELSCPWYNAE